MIYDHVDNIPLYLGITPALDTALKYIAGLRLPIDNGSTLLEHGVKAIVSEYETKPTNPKGYEAHIKYADVQFLLAGSESLRCAPLPSLTPSTDYDEASDCRFYEDPLVIPSAGAPSVILREPKATEESQSVALRLGSGYFAVLFPADAHMPGLSVDAPETVKKVVMKVPMG